MAARRAAAIIHTGGVAVFPTDTVYGLGASAISAQSIRRLFRVKRRSKDKPMAVLVRDIEMAKTLAFINAKTEKFLASVWPGPVTVVLEKREVVPDVLSAGRKTIGLRMPNCDFMLNLMQQLNIPLAATSVNLPGEPPLTNAAEIVALFKKAYHQPELIINAGKLAKSPSAVLDLTKNRPAILRMGPVSREYLMNLLGKLEGG